MDTLAKDLFDYLDIPQISGKLNYWFVRTNAGEYFEKFYIGEYIGIGWNEISNIDTIKSISKDDLKNEVESIYPQESRPGLVATYFKQFVTKMQIGDIVMIPSESSNYLLFGEIVSEAYSYTPGFIDNMEDSIEPIIKRRSVKWITKPKRRSEIDPYLVNIIYSHNTIVDAQEYKSLINRVLYTLYIDDQDQLHAIFNIGKKNDIIASDVYNLMQTVFKCGKLVSEIIGDDYSKSDLRMKSAINSAGPIEFITYGACFMIGLAALSLFINGAKIKFDLNIFKIYNTHIEIESKGLLDRIKELKQSQQKHERELQEIENASIEWKRALEVGKPNDQE